MEKARMILTPADQKFHPQLADRWTKWKSNRDRCLQSAKKEYVRELYRGVILGMFKSLGVLYRSNARSVFYALVLDMYLNLF